jgi:hypothetical protein
VFLATYDETPDQTGKNEEGRREAPLVRFLLCRVALAALRGLSGASLTSSGKRRLAVHNEHAVLVPATSSKGVVLFLEPHKLGFQVANTLLETAHLGDHAGIGTADVAE